MKIILSRKGFDSSAGGVPSPIFPNSEILSLPIPDKKSKITYKEILWKNKSIGKIVEELTKEKKRANFFAHLDPDVNKHSLHREKNWRPIFGQAGAAQKHLENQNIKNGDLFLFFGLFRKIITENNTLKFDPKSLPMHIIWGWFQIGNILKVDDIKINEYRWAKYHPHFNKDKDPLNTIYIAKDKLDIGKLKHKKIKGAGNFLKFSNHRRLTTSNSKLTLWKLPYWTFPKNGKSILSYHSDLKRWENREKFTLLNSVSRGQEFVLDCYNFEKEATEWIVSLFSK